MHQSQERWHYYWRWSISSTAKLPSSWRCHLCLNIVTQASSDCATARRAAPEELCTLTVGSIQHKRTPSFEMSRTTSMSLLPQRSHARAPFGQNPFSGLTANWLYMDTSTAVLRHLHVSPYLILMFWLCILCTCNLVNWLTATRV